MRFKLDENMPSELVADLEAAGHDAETVFDEGLSGAPDAVVVATARNEDRILLTLDMGIADVRRYPHSQLGVVVLFRPDRAGRLLVLGFARKHLPDSLNMSLAGRLLVVSSTGLRLR